MISVRALAAVAVLLAAIPQCPLGSSSDAPADAGASKSSPSPPAAAACGATFTGGCFGCYQSSCPTQFAQCFGASAAAGTFAGACATYGKCICHCTSPQDCKKCVLDPACLGCDQSSGLFACATAKCKSACGG